ncbi:MAG: DUF4129 domain-containing protein [Deltaproteobacteria bacterium]|nr:DUF4129 domain-containing protein [Deltaproteobacteria bacterium]
MGLDTIKKKNLQDIPQNPWMENLFRPALLTGMMTCLSIAMVNLVKALNPSWHNAYLLAGMILVTMEAIYSYRTLRKKGRLRTGKFRYRLTEWGTLMLLLKALTYANRPITAVVADIESWPAKPLNILSMEFIIVCVLSFLIWTATTNTMKAFDALFDRSLVQSREVDPFSSLTNRFYYGGGLLIFITGVTQWILRAGLGVLTDLGRPGIQGVLLNVLIYFVLGLILLSQTQLNILFANWRSQKMDVSANLIKRWTLYGITILVIVGMVAFLLPTGYTLGFLSSVKLMLQYGIHMIIYLVQLIWIIIMFPLKWFLSLFPLDPVQFQQESRDLPAFFPEKEIAAPASDVVHSFIFWLIFLAVVVFLLGCYLKDHPELLNWTRHLRVRYPWFTWLVRLWQWLKGGARAVSEFIPRPVIIQTQKPDEKPGSHRRRIRFAKMSARKRIIYYYLSTLKTAERSGCRRHKSQTPKEFANQLVEVLPHMDGEIDLLTQTFLHARYSRDISSHHQALSVKMIWKTIRSALRGFKRRKTT